MSGIRTVPARGRSLDAVQVLRSRPWVGAALVLVLTVVVLVATRGLQGVAQTTVNGLVSGSYFALGAVGLTLVYGILRLVNFSHGDMLTFGAYSALLAGFLGMPLWLAVVFAIAVTAVVGVIQELAIWRPMRDKGAGMIQLILASIGLAFVLRHVVQFFAGTTPRNLPVDVTSSYFFLGLRIGQTQLLVVVVGVVVLVAVGLMLRYTTLGKQMRALSDDFDLAETTGINTGRVVLLTWIFAAGLAGLAGVLSAAAVGVLTPNLGFQLLLPLFAAVILGGIGNAYGALAAGLVLGVVQEWTTLVLDSRWKLAVGFVILILALVIRPQGIFGRARTV